MNNFLGGRKETGPEASQKKHRRSRKHKSEPGKPKQGYDKKRKGKKKKQIVATQISKLGLEEFPLIFDEIRASNQRLKELIFETDAYILDKLKPWMMNTKAFDHLIYLLQLKK